MSQLTMLRATERIQQVGVVNKHAELCPACGLDYLLVVRVNNLCMEGNQRKRERVITIYIIITIFISITFIVIIITVITLTIESMFPCV